MASHNELGKMGEDVAHQFLIENGYKVITRNWFFNKKEIDIIALKDDLLIFIEVRTRASKNWEDPRESITPKKIRNIVLAADAYIKQTQFDMEVRFDVVTCIPSKDNSKWEIELIEKAFIPGVE